MRWSVLFLLLTTLLFSVYSSAGVYQCVNETGTIEFRDSPCTSSLETQTFLPIQYDKASPKQIKKDEKDRELNAKKRAVLDRKEERLRIRTDKQRVKLEQKEKKRQERCARTREKINEIQDKLRSGCKLKTLTRLKAELEHHQKMEQKNCSRHDQDSL